MIGELHVGSVFVRVIPPLAVTVSRDICKLMEADVIISDLSPDIMVVIVKEFSEAAFERRLKVLRTVCGVLTVKAISYQAELKRG